MAWNRPSENGEAVSRPLQKRSGDRFPLKGAIIGAVVVLSAAVAAWWLWPSEETRQDAASTKKNLIKEVTPAITTNAVVKEKTALQKRYPALNIPDDWDKPYPPQAYWPDGRLKEHSRYVKVITNAVRKSKALVESTFADSAERELAHLLLHDPGKMIRGRHVYDQRFVAKFLASLDKPIVIEPEDSPRIAEVKQAVIEAKKELKARHDAGEDIAEVLNQSMADLKELSHYRQEIDNQILQIRKEKGDSLTDKDYQDLIGAANKMLEDRGCSPIRDQDLIIRRLRLHQPEETNDAEN